jgi:hypothetical protein
MARPTKQLEDIEFDGWDQLDALIVWASQEYCAEKLGISVDSLARRLKERGYSFADYKAKRQEPMRINLLKKQYDVAMQGNVSMLIWLGKQYLSQSEKQDINYNDVTKKDIDELKKEAESLLKKASED